MVGGNLAGDQEEVLKTDTVEKEIGPHTEEEVKEKEILTEMASMIDTKPGEQTN